MSFDLDDPRITAYVFGELDQQQRAAFEAQLDQSAELREAVQQTQTVLDQLTSELQSEPQMAMSDTQRQSVAEEIQRVSASDAKSQPATDIPAISETAFSKRKWVAFAAVAASLLLVCGLTYTYNQRDGGWRVAATPDRGDSPPASIESPPSEHDDPRLIREEFEMAQSDEFHEISTDSTSASEVSAHEASTLADTMAPSDDAYAASVAGDAPTESADRSEPASKPPVLGERAKYESLGKKNEINEAAHPASSLPSTDVLMEETRPAAPTSYSGRSRPVTAADKDDLTLRQKEFDQTAEKLQNAIAEQKQSVPNLMKVDAALKKARERSAGRPAPAPASSAPYGEMGGYGGAGGYGSSPNAPAATPAPGQLAAGSKPHGAEHWGDRMGMGGGGYGGGYGMESGDGPAIRPDSAMMGRGGYLGTQPSGTSPGADRLDLGTGPGTPGDRYEPIVENAFQAVTDHPLSTFSIDVDTASYSKVRMHLLQNNRLPRPDAVRIEELVNYFTYDYQPPEDDVPFAAHIEVADCPWTPGHRLVRFGIKGQEMDREERPTSNLVFLLDVSGSMSPANKLPLVKQGMKMLVDQLGENDRVAIAVYAGAAGLVLDSTTGDHKQVILDSLDRLHAGGSTNGGQGIRLAYQTALDNFVGGGVNRVILCTDGDFNVGTTGTDELVRLAEENAKTGVFLSVLGFGMGNHNDSMLEQVSNKGNGNYAFIDNQAEARKVLVEEMMGTLVTIAKDVKIQVEFNPAEVSAYRLIGYENRILAAEDFNDDKKDAGEIGAGHTVTALYEVVPAGSESGVATSSVDDLRYQSETKLSKAAKTGEILTLKMRYKQPDGDTSALLTFPVTDEGNKFGQASQDFRFAAAVASFGMLLRNSQHLGNATYAGVLETATEAASSDTSGYRGEFLKMVERAGQLSGQ